MTFLVPYDGSPLSKAALTRARVYAVALKDAPRTIRQKVLREHPLGVLVMSVIPDSAEYAKEKGWIHGDEPFDDDRVVEKLHEAIIDIDPGADFLHEPVDADASEETISQHLRRRAKRDDITTIFIGSENAGRIITSTTKVGGDVAVDEDYDVHIVRKQLPPEVRESLRSEFFFVD